MTTILTPVLFRKQLPAFADATVYPDPAIAMAIAVADKVVSSDPNVWGDLRDYGVALLAAHNLALDARDTRAAKAGKIPGASLGIESSKSVGGVSVSYSNPLAGATAAMGDYALTVFGIRFYRLAKQMGMGGFQSAGEPAPGGEPTGVWSR